MNGRRPHAVVLDMDGTLLDTEPLAARAWSDAAAAIGVAFDPSLAHRMIGRTFADCRGLVVERHGTDYPTDRLMSGWHAAYDAIVERDGLALKPGVAALFDWLDAQGIVRAVATSTRRERARTKLEHTRLWTRIDALVGGDEVERGKPDPAIYRLAAERLGVAPADCIAFEDSENGARAAQAAGVRVVIVPDLKHPPEDVAARAHGVIDSLADAIAHVPHWFPKL